MSKEIRNGFPLSLHYLLFGKTIGGMRWGGRTLARQAEGRAAVLRQIHSLFQVGAFGDLTDGQLLERFMTGHKESAEPAFTALVERHGPMVWRVCRRVLTDSHQAQDAFQATVLVLVQQAGSVRHKDSGRAGSMAWLTAWPHVLVPRSYGGGSMKRTTPRGKNVSRGRTGMRAPSLPGCLTRSSAVCRNASARRSCFAILKT